jgi:hypothetical protein
MALSDMTVRQARATGKQKRMYLGTYPEVCLREARALRDQARALLAKGINPKLDRKRKLVDHYRALLKNQFFSCTQGVWMCRWQMTLIATGDMQAEETGLLPSSRHFQQARHPFQIIHRRFDR